METKSMLGMKSILTALTAVTLVGNDKLEGKPLITATLDKAGQPKTDLMGNEIGSIRLEQTSRNINGSYLNNRRRVAFISGSIDVLRDLLAQNGLKEGSLLPGKIVITESLQPMWEGQTSKVNPETTEAIGVTVNEKFYPVYMKMTYTENPEERDTLIRTPEHVIAWLTTVQALAASQNVKKNESAGVPGE